MRDLTDVLGAAVEARARALDGLAPAPGLAGLRTRVRRRRAVRHTVEAVAVLPVVAALGVGGWLLLGDRDPVPPVVTPSPTSTPTPDPTPSPDPTSSPTPEIVLGDPIVEPGLPPHYEMPDGLLEETEPGWVLATYAPETWYAGRSGFAPATFESVLLVSPDGATYEAVRLSTGAPTEGTSGGRWAEHELLAWESGTTTAVVRETVYVQASAGTAGTMESTQVMTLDLLTGTLTEDGPNPGPEGAPNSRGDMWLQRRGVVVDASGEQLGMIDHEVESASGWCDAVSWWTADSVLAACYAHDPATWNDGVAAYLDLDPRLVTFTLDQMATGEGTVLRTLGPGDARPWEWGSATVADGLVVAQGAILEPGLAAIGECPTGVYLFSREGTERLPASESHPDVELNIFESDVIGRTIYVMSTGGCSGDPRPSLLTSYDVDTRTFTELVGPPPRAGAAEYPWVQGLTSYAVGS
jgi:hypothetical protein